MHASFTCSKGTTICSTAITLPPVCPPVRDNLCVAFPGLAALHGVSACGVQQSTEHRGGFQGDEAAGSQV